MILDLYVIYQFLKRLTTPFNEWPAFKLNIIDEKGTILKKRSELRLVVEREAFTVLDTLVLKLKRILEKIPGGATRFGSYAAALWLIKESKNYSNLDDLIESIDTNTMFELSEEVAANNVGNGSIAGVGIGPKGEPPKKLIKNKSVLKRFKDMESLK